MKLKLFSLLFFLIFLQNSCTSSNFKDLGSVESTVKDIFLAYLTHIKVSSECWQAYNLTYQFIDFIDASAKIPNGLKNLNFIDLGNYDECMDIFNTTSIGNVYGKYCLTLIPIQMTAAPTGQTHRMPMMAAGDRVHMGFHLGYCTPHQCSASDLDKILNFGRSENKTIIIQENYCYTKADDNSLSTGAILTLVLIGFFEALVLLSSLYDVVLRHQNKKPTYEIVLSFSLITNGEKLFKSTQNPDQLLCLNGIKAISMMWVIFGHQYSLMMFGGVNNWKDVLGLMSDKANMFLFNAPYSVDSFLMIGGLVTMYTFMKAMDKGVKFNIFMYYLHRYLRLTPAIAILIPVHIFLLPYMGSGPFWAGIDSGYSESCRKYWWSALLYVQNFANSNADNCIPQIWYLSVDMQLFVLSPFVLLPSVWYPKYRRYVLGALMGLGVIIPTVISYEYDLTSNFADITPKAMVGQLDYMTYYYFQTHCRFGPYVVGLLFGDLLFQFKKTKRSYLNIKSAAILWVFGFGLLWTCLYGSAPLRGNIEFDPIPHAFVNGFGRTIWSIGLGIIIYLCVSGYGGFVDTFLSLPIFQLLTKLAYSMYLVHYSFVGMRWAAARDTFHASHLYIMHIYWADFAVVLFMSIFYSLTFESPIIILEKYLLGGKKETKKVNNSTQEDNNKV